MWCSGVTNRVVRTEGLHRLGSASERLIIARAAHGMQRMTILRCSALSTVQLTKLKGRHRPLVLPVP